VQGWARDTALAGPAHVRVTFAGQLMAEALAETFRADLLRSGQDHGHHAFNARLVMPLPPGKRALELHVSGSIMPWVVEVPALLPPTVRRVEDLLAVPPGWTTKDVVAHPGCLDMAGNFQALGPDRFVDAVFHFAFGRWPSKAEVNMNVADLQAGRIGPEALLLECLRSRERADMKPALLSPYDPAFPFQLPIDPR
jgi:hypothetical protein